MNMKIFFFLLGLCSNLMAENWFKLAGDALQLASARAAMETPSRVQFMCLDKLLNRAAIQEGFNLCIQHS